MSERDESDPDGWAKVHGHLQPGKWTSNHQIQQRLDKVDEDIIRRLENCTLGPNDRQMAIIMASKGRAPDSR